MEGNIGPTFESVWLQENQDSLPIKIELSDWKEKDFKQVNSALKIITMEHEDSWEIKTEPGEMVEKRVKEEFSNSDTETMRMEDMSELMKDDELHIKDECSDSEDMTSLSEFATQDMVTVDKEAIDQLHCHINDDNENDVKSDDEEGMIVVSCFTPGHGTEVVEMNIERKRRLTRYRVMRWRAKQSRETLERLRKEDNERHADRILNERQERGVQIKKLRSAMSNQEEENQQLSTQRSSLPGDASKSSIPLLDEKLKIHNINMVYKCRMCEKTFDEWNGLMMHIRSHSGDKCFKCELCGKMYTRMCNVITHLKCHSGEQLYKCKTCGKSFSTKNHLTGHSSTHKVHIIENLFKCNTCRRTFSDCCHKTLHVSNHTGVKPHRCDMCRKEFNFVKYS